MLIADYNVERISPKTVILINKYVSTCIIFNRRVENVLRAYNIGINIQIVDPFFLPLKRDLSGGAVMMSNFSIGIFSNLSGKDFEWIKKFQSCLLTKFQSVRLSVFHNRKAFNRSNDGINYVSIDTTKLSEKLNDLSVFLHIGDNTESVQLFHTALYLGVPCISCKNAFPVDSRLLKFAFVYKGENKIEDIVDAIIDLKEDYIRHNKKSIKASGFIEDKFSIEKIGHEIIKVVLENYTLNEVS